MEYTYIPEKKLKNHPKSVSEEELKIILRQIEKNIICKIKSNEGQGNWGTGFFAKIPFPDSLNNLPVLMTNNHIIEDNVKNKYEIFFPKKKMIIKHWNYVLMIQDIFIQIKNMI